ncbi:uncharacterized protein LOC113204174 [Frankliniella occidentalis]|uniref:Uncharacterized protein LOC113204174 n=1 Tax=Frankliniella occidentalis TaxID=133901 RepID=A0A9C6UDK3_FRAOC|nr:uncharacterized protein LOC113204174 [Frankliniella occidentalis]
MARFLCFAVAVAFAVVAALADPSLHLTGALLEHHLQATQGHGPHGQAPQEHHTLAGALVKHHLQAAGHSVHQRDAPEAKPVESEKSPKGKPQKKHLKKHLKKHHAKLAKKGPATHSTGAVVPKAAQAYYHLL